MAEEIDNYSIEKRYIHKNDGNVWINLTVSLVRNDIGEPKYFIGVVEDISKRRKIQEELREAKENLELRVQQRTADLYAIQERLSLFIEHVPSAIAMFDSQMHYLATSRRWLTDYNLSQEDIIGCSHYDVFPEVPEHWKEDHRQVLAGETVKSEEDSFVRANGDVDWLRYELRPWFNQEGKIGGVIMFTEVITEMKQAKEALRQANAELEQRVRERTAELEAAKDKAESADRAKSAFIAHMSHELRTPLNGILGFAQILERDSTLTPKQFAGIDIIHKSGSHLLTLIEDILYIAKIEAGKLELQKSEFHFTSFLDNLVALVRVRAEEKGVAFNYQALSVLPNTIKTDETRLRQILLNLLGNAVKFTVTGGGGF